MEGEQAIKSQLSSEEINWYKTKNGKKYNQMQPILFLTQNL